MHFANFFRLFPLALFLRGSYNRQKKRLHTIVIPLIRKTERSSGFTCSGKTERRIKNYALRLAPLMADSYCLLREQALSEKEARLHSILAAASPLIDDFFDLKEADETRIHSLIFAPQSIDALSFEEAFVIECSQQLHHAIAPHAPFWIWAQLLYESQRHSRKQKQATLSLTEIEQISDKKGAYSALLFASILDGKLDQKYTEAIYALGAWFQQADDLHDFPSDAQNRILTLPVAFFSAEKMQEKFQEKKVSCFEQWRKTNLPKSSLKKFLFLFFCLSITCEVCILHYKKQLPNFDASAGNYKPLICKWWKAKQLFKGFYIGLSLPFAKYFR